MKNNKGITLISLVVTIIILLILAGTATYTGVEAINNSKYTKFTTELKIVQSHVNNWYEDLKPTDVDNFDTNFTTNITSKFTSASVTITTANSDNTAKGVLDELGDSDYTNYYILDSADLKKLKVDGVEQKVMVNIKKRKVVSYNGIKDKSGDILYTIEDNAIYNVQYVNEISQTYK